LRKPLTLNPSPSAEEGGEGHGKLFCIGIQAQGSHSIGKAIGSLLGFLSLNLGQFCLLLGFLSLNLGQFRLLLGFLSLSLRQFRLPLGYLSRCHLSFEGHGHLLGQEQPFPGDPAV
jgi:hypothetical protein